MHKSTVKRRLKERGIIARTPAKKEFLTGDHKAKRCAFATKYSIHPVDYWRGATVFSDESTLWYYYLHSQLNLQEIFKGSVIFSLVFYNFKMRHIR